MKTPDYLTYERYKKKKKKDDSKSGLLIAITTFFVGLLIFTVIAKSLSPDVDVTIGGDSETDAKETGLGVKKFIDERLKMIQMEDDSAGVSYQKGDGKLPQDGYNANGYPQASDTKISSKTPKAQPADEEINEEPMEPIQLTPKASVNNPPRPSKQELSTPYETPKMSKVYVGRYATMEQARVAQEILVDSGINITPFVKNIGGAYTLQVGSYGSRAKAEGLASELQRNNFPARIVQE